MFSLRKERRNHQGRIVEEWYFHAKNNLVSGCSVEDLDKDGLKEIIFATTAGELFCIDELERRKWSYKSKEEVGEVESFFYDENKGPGGIAVKPIIADLDDDGLSEVLFSTTKGTIHCLNHKGELIWKKELEKAPKKPPVIIDLDNDGLKEIIIPVDNKLIILDNHGHKKGIIETEDTITSEPLIIKNKGPTQIIIGQQKTISSYDPEGNLHWAINTNNQVSAKPHLLLTRDWIVVGDHDGIMRAIDLNGNEVWSFKTEGGIHEAAVSRDVNKDGKEEIIFGSCDNKAYCLTIDGKIHWSYETDFWVAASPIITDIDGDGEEEVIIGSYDEHLYILAGRGEYNLDYVPGLSGIINQTGHYTNVITKNPGERIGKALWKLRTEGLIMSCELLWDEKNQEHNAIIINTREGISKAKHENEKKR